MDARSCAQLASSFNIQLLGDRAYGWQLAGHPTLPRKTTIPAVWSLGGSQSTSGVNVYGWASAWPPS